MEARIANGASTCANCGHYGILHDWVDIEEMGRSWSRRGSYDYREIGVGCGAENGNCRCSGFEQERERPQERLI